jgi:hypothetical protein
VNWNCSAIKRDLSRTAGEAKFPLDCSLMAKEVKRLTGFHDLQAMLMLSYVADICGGDLARTEKQNTQMT